MPEYIETSTSKEEIELPSDNLVNYVMTKTPYKDPHFVAASIIAYRYDDPNVPSQIINVLRGDA